MCAFEKRASSGSLSEAVARCDGSAVATFLREQDFTLIEASGAPGGDGTTAMTAEVDGNPALVAFTSTDHAARFAESMPDMLDADESVPGFVVDCVSLLSYLPQGFGVLLNPGSDDCVILPPKLVEQLRTPEID